MEGGGWREGGGAGYASGWGFIKILPEAKSSSQLSFFSPPKTEVKRNVQRFHVLTGKQGLEENVISKKMLIFFRQRNVFIPFIPFTFPNDVLFFYTSAFWLFSSTFSSSFFSSSEEPFSFSPVFQLPCLKKNYKRLSLNILIFALVVLSAASK